MEKLLQKRFYIGPKVQGRKQTRQACVNMNVILEAIKEEGISFENKAVRAVLLNMGASACKHHRNTRCVANVKRIDTPSEPKPPQWQIPLLPGEFLDFFRELEQDFPI
jgi:hypothetical protein